MKRAPVVGLLLLVLFLFTACVAGPNEFVNTPDSDGEIAGFWRGLWHGIIAPFTFIISLFSDTVYVYEVHNAGGWYDFGFLLGASIIFGGSSGGAASRHRK
jgi:hypothetical protein